MDPETSSQIAFIDDEDARKVLIKKGTFVVVLLIFVGTFIGHFVTIALGVPMFKHCHNVALIVMIIGSVLGLIQVNKKLFD